jgi:hypothetical protein
MRSAALEVDIHRQHLGRLVEPGFDDRHGAWMPSADSNSSLGMDPRIERCVAGRAVGVEGSLRWTRARP